MRISKQAKREAKELFRVCQVEGLLDEARVRLVVSRVLDGKPRGYLGTLHYFQRLVKLEMERRTARVESAGELPADLREMVQGSLEKRYGRGLQVNFAVQPELVAGMRIRVGSDVFDGSVSGRLQDLKSGF
jgi:F-type H+-transporting ATPase subunit delta